MNDLVLCSLPHIWIPYSQNISSSTDIELADAEESSHIVESLSLLSSSLIFAPSVVELLLLLEEWEESEDSNISVSESASSLLSSSGLSCPLTFVYRMDLSCSGRLWVISVSLVCILVIHSLASLP